MKRLAVIPSDPIDEYLAAGYSAEWLRAYYNPCGFFDEVYLLSPLEKVQRECLGLKVIPTDASEFRGRLRQLQIDVVRAYGGNWACRLACEHRVDGIPVVVSVHDREAARLYDAVKKADVVLSVSRAVDRLVTAKVPDSNKRWLLPNRVDFQLMRPRASDRAAMPVDLKTRYKIIFVGRLTKEKNLDTLLKALQHLGPDYGLLVVGLGDRLPYQRLVEQLGIVERTVFLDRIAHEQLAEYFSWADCMCVPSRQEGFGMVFIEALACEAVVVTSAIAPMTEFMDDGKNGLLVSDYENPAAIAQAIARACNDQSLRQKVKQNARGSVECFERSKIDRLEADYYRKLLEMKERGAFRRSPLQQLLDDLRISL